MKTTLTFIAMAILTVATAQATSVKWAAKDVTDAEGNKITGAVAYVFVTADTKATPATTIVDRDTIVSKISAGDTSVLSQATANGTVSTLKQANITFDGGWSEGEKVTAFMVIYDNAAASSAGKAIITDSIQTTLGSMGTTTASFGSMTGATWTAVPEPTSVALLALGLAALGLKRKVA